MTNDVNNFNINITDALYKCAKESIVLVPCGRRMTIILTAGKGSWVKAIIGDFSKQSIGKATCRLLIIL